MTNGRKYLLIERDLQAQRNNWLNSFNKFFNKVLFFCCKVFRFIESTSKSGQVSNFYESVQSSAYKGLVTELKFIIQII